MAETQIRFEDGHSYEQCMGEWSRRVGTVFIDWLSGLSPIFRISMRGGVPM